MSIVLESFFFCKTSFGQNVVLRPDHGRLVNGASMKMFGAPSGEMGRHTWKALPDPTISAAARSVHLSFKRTLFQCKTPT